jgi:hypothetical protein
MAQEHEILKIEIPVEEETPFVPERPRPNVKVTVKEAGKTAVSAAAHAAKKVWNSEPRRKVTRGAARGTAKIVGKSSQFVGQKVGEVVEKQARDRATAVQTRIKETDWKTEVQTGTAHSLNWLSQRLAGLAARLNAPRPKNHGD